MATVDRAIHIDAPAARVFAAIADPNELERWHPSFTSVTAVTDGPTRLGSRSKVVSPRLGTFEMKVVAFEPGQRIRWTAQNKMMTMEHENRVADDGTGARFQQTGSARPRGMGFLLVPLMPRMLERSLRHNEAALQAYLAGK